MKTSMPTLRTLLLALATLGLAYVSGLATQKPSPKKPIQKGALARKAIPEFSIVFRSNNDKKKLESFLSDHERKVFSLDVFLSDEDLKDVRSVGEKSLYVSLAYKDKDGDQSGSEWIIDLKDGENDLVLNEKTGRLQAYIKVISIEGPHMGIMSIYSKPVSIEKVQK